LDSLVTSFEKETSIEIAIVTLDSNYTSRKDFDNYTLKLPRYWEVGKSRKNNGVLIGLSKSIRYMRIQNGFGIEEVLSDAETKSIIDSSFIPEFKKGKYFKGTFEGVLDLMIEVR